LNQRLSVIMFS